MNRKPQQRFMFLLLLMSFCIIIDSAQAVVITNGGLELNSGDNFKTVFSGNSYASWASVGRGDVEFIRNVGTGPTFEGEGFVDLNGVGYTGAIEQTLNTLPDLQYEIRFALSGNPGLSKDKQGNKTMDVLWNGQFAGAFTFVHQPGDTQQNYRWEQHRLTLTASASGNDVLRFASTTTAYNDAGPLLDGITVTAIPVTGIPEPSSVVLLALGTLLVSLRRHSFRMRKRVALAR